MDTNTIDLVTPDDHDAGYKDLDIQFRNGRKAKLRLHAPNHRTASTLTLEIAKTKSAECVIAACNPVCEPPLAAAFDVNKLTPQSGDLVEFVAMSLTFGYDFQKKSARAGIYAVAAMLKKTPTPPAVANSPSSVPDSRRKK